MAMAFLRILKLAGWLALLAVAALALFVAARRSPADLPWVPLDPAATPGLATGPKIAALAADPGGCRTLIARAGIAWRALAPRSGGGVCGYSNGIAWAAGGAREARYAPAAPPLACPLAAALAMWEWDIVQPAAVRAFGTTVAGIDHYGSYACRRLYGRARGGWSEHAGANAIDIAGFRLTDGRRITVARDWRGVGAEAAFLRDVRDGACRLFATTLSPDFNAAHRDHFHLDEARRGGGWRICR